MNKECITGLVSNSQSMTVFKIEYKNTIEIKLKESHTPMKRKTREQKLHTSMASTVLPVDCFIHLRRRRILPRIPLGDKGPF